MARYLVTGGAGFIGSHLVDELISQGHVVMVLDDLSTGDKSRLLPEVRFARGSILDYEVLKALIAEADGVFHLAAVVSVQRCIEALIDAHRVNLTGSLAVFEAAAAQRCPVVYASSAAVYGEAQDGTCHERGPTAPISAYGADKLACELHAAAMARTHDLASIGLRFFNVYGPRQDPASPYSGVISRFVANRMVGRAHTVFGDGRQSRDFVFVRDVARALVAAMDALQDGRPQAQVANVCTGQAVTLLDLIAAIDGASDGPSSRIDFAPPRTGDIRHSCGDARHMRALLGRHAETLLSKGLAETMNALRREQDSVAP